MLTVTVVAGIVLTQLLDWLHVHFVEYDQMALDLLKDEVPEENPNFWKVVRPLTSLLRPLTSLLRPLTSLLRPLT